MINDGLGFDFNLFIEKIAIALSPPWTINTLCHSEKLCRKHYIHFNVFARGTKSTIAIAFKKARVTKNHSLTFPLYQNISYNLQPVFQGSHTKEEKCSLCKGGLKELCFLAFVHSALPPPMHLQNFELSPASFVKNAF